MPLGGVAGCILMSPLNELVGRRTSVIGSCLAYSLGAGLCAGARSVHMLFAGRFILGIGIGLESVVPAYVSECTPFAYRGNMVSLFQFNIALGEVLGYAIAAIFVDVKGGWRFILGSSLVFSTVLFFGLFFLPESPRYLLHKGEVGLAYGVWQRLRDMNDPENKLEFLEMMESLKQQEESERYLNKRLVWLDFFTKPRCRRSIIYANIMIILGQLTGVNAVMYYMAKLMENIRFSSKDSVFMSLVGGGSLLLGTIPAILYMDYCGRRFWANAMLPGFFVGLVFVGVGYLIPVAKTAAKAVYLIGVILYMGFFGSYSCLTWVIPSEIYPTYLRSYGMTSSSGLLFLCSRHLQFHQNVGGYDKHRSYTWILRWYSCDRLDIPVAMCSRDQGENIGGD
ncbi:DEKNAAC103190 [Brettanomyces naardenensis]|uniref:DEKNAAC103190 n=1 Tax=Brettanomyces naardenensis TaxID=13370 RepID=A0A448YMT7_BRENA|nr:DEKNAAC103190 [Brettanomyces naardenensis]